MAFLIWIETDRGERLRRGLERDGPEALDLWRSWMDQEDIYIAEHARRPRANLVISGATGCVPQPHSEFQILECRPPAE